MKILLISVQKNLNNLNLKLLHSLLRSKNYDSTLLYINRFMPENKKLFQALESFVRDLNPSWVGITLTASEFTSARDISLFLKSKFDSFPVIWGGIYPTCVPHKCAEFADYLCIGEGEKTVVDVCEALTTEKSLKSVNNLAWLEGKEIVKNPLNPPIDDLDSLPFVPRLAPNSFLLFKDKVEPLSPKLYIKHSAFRGGIYRIVNSRGCPYQCTFCVNSIFPQLYSCWKTRWPKPERIVDEIYAGVNENLPLAFVSIMDDNFFAHRMEYLEKFFSLYKQKVNQPFIAFSSPNFITDEKLSIAVDAGLASIHVGLQTGSERSAKEIYKRIGSPKRYKHMAELVHKYPIVPYYDVICDNPLETEEDEIQTIKMLSELPKPYFFLLFSLTLYEGTQLRKDIEKVAPEYLHDDTQRDFLITKPTPINILKHLATIYPKSYLDFLLAHYLKKPSSFYTKFLIRISNFFGLYIFQPLLYIWMLLRFNRYSLTKTLKSLPLFFDIRAFHIFGHFHSQKDTTLE